MMQTFSISEPRQSDTNDLSFLWLELTNRCNLQCKHCYSESSPHSGARDLLTETNYLQIIEEAHALGCRQIQFIGGEPTLNKNLPLLVAHGADIGYDFIEVFTNLIQLNDELLAVFQKYKVSVATSFYSSNPLTHDLITTTTGSFTRTTGNIRRILEAELDLRVGVVEMDANINEYETTVDFLSNLGVKKIGHDKVRGFGRAQPSAPCLMGDLCGQCANNILAIGPDGVVSPCIMSKQWAVGSVLVDSLTDIASSERLSRTRHQIAEVTANNSADCYPQCGPNRQQCVPECGPSRQCVPCGPNGGHKCQPNAWCGPAR